MFFILFIYFLSEIPRSNFTNRKWQSEEALEKILNNSDESEFSDKSSENYDRDMSSESVNRPITSQIEEHDCSDDEEAHE